MANHPIDNETLIGYIDRVICRSPPWHSTDLLMLSVLGGSFDMLSPFEPSFVVGGKQWNLQRLMQ